MAVEQLDGSAQGAGRPPGVIVAEGDIGAVDQAGPDGAGRPAPVAPQPDHLDARVVSRTSSAVPSVEPLSTTMIGGCSGRAHSLVKVPSSSGPRLRVAMTTATRAGDAGMGCWLPAVGRTKRAEP